MRNRVCCVLARSRLEVTDRLIIVVSHILQKIHFPRL